MTTDVQSEVEAHKAALSKVSKDKDQQTLFDHLYGCLSILDGKAASLLSFNSIIIAVFAIFMAGSPTTRELFLLNSGILLIFASSILLLLVVWIYWSTTQELANLDQNAVTLLEIRNTRTRKYRIAWVLSIIAIGLLTLFGLVRFIKNLCLLT